MSATWNDEAKVAEYLGRVDRLAARRAGEAELIEALPMPVTSVLDLGCGDGRLIDVVLAARPETTHAIGLDNSAPMLEHARARFGRDDRVQVLEHDLAVEIPLGRFDVVVSGFAIHHLTHDRKRSLFVEIAQRLRPGGVFANLEVVACATPKLHEEFNRRIGRPGGDPQDILAGADQQLGWMREAGFEDVDCNWRWRGFALLVGTAPAVPTSHR